MEQRPSPASHLHALTPPTTASNGPAKTGRKKIGAEVAEGLLLLENAARLRIKNIVLVDVLTTDGGVDVRTWTSATRRVLRELSREAHATERRLADQLNESRERRGVADHEHDYRLRDLGNLDRRRRVARRVRKRLARWSADPARVTELLRTAQQDAWQEIRSASRSLAGDGAADSADQAQIDERLNLLTSVDLPALAARRAARTGSHERPT